MHTIDFRTRILGCSTKTTPPQLAMPNASLNVGPPSIVIDQPEIQWSPPKSQWHRGLIDADAFFPSDDVTKLELRELPANARIEPVAHFPSPEKYLSADCTSTLTCVTELHTDILQNSLVVESPWASSAYAVWSTPKSFDVLWSWSSGKAAVTHWMSGDTSEVLLLDLSFKKVYPLPNVFPKELESFLLPSQLRTRWMFRAIGWAPYDQLIIRGVGHDLGPPHQDYGCEFTVVFMKGSDPKYPAHLIRAYKRDPK